ncbi:hypothetical protein [Pimelobacter simplex]|uniref:hypothetical protein n=1 Tax=Nocardioides simplex TaxID=2045 RepID=UPI001931415A|nr:hypothetical protein [Pimelobacter simplex]
MTASSSGGGSRQWSWASSESEAEARRLDASQLVGSRIRAVHYINIDYRRYELQSESVEAGPRAIVADAEWADPTWLFDGFDAVDYGFEITTDLGKPFSVTWDPPGDREGIGMQPVPLLGSGVRSDADVAIWDLTGRHSAWTRLVGKKVTDVVLHYVPWLEGEEGLWCPRITIHCGEVHVEVLLGDAKSGALVLSADNVAVLHPDTPLPQWTS